METQLKNHADNFLKNLVTHQMITRNVGDGCCGHSEKLGRFRYSLILGVADLVQIE